MLLTPPLLIAPVTATRTRGRPRNPEDGFRPGRPLTSHIVKQESFSPAVAVAGASAVGRSFVPRMHLWPTLGSTTSPLPTPNVDEESQLSEEDNTELLKECNKLKGVVWPGMDIFDSATPEMRRKRNQKKDVSVVEQLQANSVVVEPTEFVFEADGTKKKEKVINGRVDLSSSPFRQPASPPRKEKRVPLADKSVNSTAVATSRFRFGAPTVGYQSAADERAAQFTSTFGTLDHKRKRGFQVYDDQHNNQRASAQERSDFGHPKGFNTLNSTYHSPFDYHHLVDCPVDLKPIQQYCEEAPDSCGSRTCYSSSGNSNSYFDGTSADAPMYGAMNHIMQYTAQQYPFGPEVASQLPDLFDHAPAYFGQWQAQDQDQDNGCHDEEDEDRTISEGSQDFGE